MFSVQRLNLWIIYGISPTILLELFNIYSVFYFCALILAKHSTGIPYETIFSYLRRQT